MYRENLIFLPVFLGLIIEVILRCMVSNYVDSNTLLSLDIRAKVVLFISAFLVFYSYKPKSKRLLAFMVVALVSCIISTSLLNTFSFAVFGDIRESIKTLTFYSPLSFNDVYRSVDFFIVYSWIAGAKENVKSFLNSNTNTDDSANRDRDKGYIL